MLKIINTFMLMLIVSLLYYSNVNFLLNINFFVTIFIALSKIMYQ